MNPHEEFAARTKKLEALAYQLDRLIDRRITLIHEIHEVRKIVENRHHEGLAAASLLSDLLTYRDQVRTDEHELIRLLQSVEEFIGADQSDG
ncbi:MAG: hypothetical protein VX454_07700 [Pseudomonadota bacterium]|nr:hypothetical protein [Pseudomonadota bacterium]